MTASINYLALDVGQARVGVASGNNIAKLPSPYTILDNNVQIFENIIKIVKDNNIQAIVVGLPRDIEGRETEQSAYTRAFSAELSKHIDIDIFFADESLSSKRAEGKFRSFNETSMPDKIRKHNQVKRHFDDVAACYILEEFFETT